MNVLLVGHAGNYNRGCQAIVYSTVSLIRRYFHDVHIKIATLDYANDRTSHIGPDVSFIRSPFVRIPYSADWVSWQFRRLYSKNVRRNYFRINKLSKTSLFDQAIKEADVVLSIGGDTLSTDYGYPGYYLLIHERVKKMKKKLVIWAASIGPYGEEGPGILDNLRLADLITVRESMSYEYLYGSGFDKGKIRLCADPAFLLSPKSLDDFVDYRDTIGFNISPLAVFHMGSITIGRLIDESARFLNDLLENTSFKVSLIPHSVSLSGIRWHDDTKVLDQVRKRIFRKDRVVAMPGGYDAGQIKYVISKCRFFIGARTHSTIAALSSGVPTVGLSYGTKSKGIYRDLFGDGHLLVDIGHYSCQALWETVQCLFREEKEIRSILKDKIPQMIRSAEANILHLKELME